MATRLRERSSPSKTSAGISIRCASRPGNGPVPPGDRSVTLRLPRRRSVETHRTTEGGSGPRFAVLLEGRLKCLHLSVRIELHSRDAKTAVILVAGASGSSDSDAGNRWAIEPLGVDVRALLQNLAFRSLEINPPLSIARVDRDGNTVWTVVTRNHKP